MNDLLRITGRDNVAVALRPLRAGETVEAGGVRLTLAADHAGGSHVRRLHDAPVRQRRRRR